MGTTSARLERYLLDELADCRAADVDRRLDELDALEATLSDARLSREVDIFSALGNETRYRIVRGLVAAGEELCVCELDPLVDVSESGLSHALSHLVEAGLVEGRKDGRWKKYRATNRAIALVTVLGGSVADA